MNKSNVTLASLKGELKSLGIRQVDVAKAAGVGRTMVVNVFAERTKSRNVIETARRLIIRKKARALAAKARRVAEAAPTVNDSAEVEVGA